MTKSELIEAINAQQQNLSPSDIEMGVNCILEALVKALCDNQRIEIRGFGRFILSYRAPRTAHNPKTGQKLVTSSKYIPRFKPGKELKDRVNANKEQ